MLRLADARDLESLYDLETVCFQKRRFRPEHLAWIVTNPHAQVLVQENGRGIDGSLMVLFDGTTCRVLSVGVRPSRRRRGIGRQLMVAAERLARARGSRVVRLEVSVTNRAAIRLYRGLGYQADGILHGYYSWGEDALSMSKPLRDANP